MGAHNLVAGNGFSRYSGNYEIRPISGFPPFLSFILAGGLFLGLDGYAVSRFLNAGFFGGTILLAGGLSARYSRDWRGGLLASALLLASEPLVHWHSWVMSEGTYLFLLAAGICLYLQALRRESTALLVVAGFLFATATLTRYIGVALIGAAALTHLLARHDRGSLRARGLLGFLGASLLPVVGWLARNQVVGGTGVNRELNFHGVDGQLARWYLAETSSWFVPHEVPLPTALRAALALLLLAFLLAILLRTSAGSFRLARGGFPLRLHLEDEGTVYLTLVGTALLGHLAVLAANSLFLDASTSPSAVPRYLTPVYLLLVLLAAVFIVRWLRSGGGRGWRRLAVAYLLVLLSVKGANVVSLLSAPIANMGYMGYRLRWTEEVEALADLGQRTVITNNPELIYVLSDRPAYMRPIPFDHYQQERREDYQHQLEATEERLQEGAVFVVFRPVEAADRATIEFAQVEKLGSFAHAVFYGYPSKVPALEAADGG